MSGLEIGGSELPSVLRDAVAAHRSGALDDAYALYRGFVDEHPRHPTALQLLGLLHSQRGEYEAAIAHMRESLHCFPEQAEVANNLGNALARCGRFNEAIESYSQAIRLQPRYAEALLNLGLCYLEADRLEEAGSCFQGCLDLRPEAAAWLGLGNVRKRQQDYEAAISCYQESLSLRPDYAEAHHNLGVCLRMRQRPDEALRHYEAASRLGLDRAALYHNLGNARADLQDVTGAIDAYRAALARNPADLASHSNLNALLWQQELLEDYLKSYVEALTQHPAAIQLRLAYAMALNQQEAFDAAENVLIQGLSHSPRSSELRSLLAYTLEGQGKWADALQWHAVAVDMPGSDPNHRISFARALLACGRPEEALHQAEIGAVQMPFNQRALAYLGLCWRMLGDVRDRILNDYDNLVQVYEIPVPPQYAGCTEFNARLMALLDTLHIGKRHPAEQTLRGGTQTHGDLFLRREPEIQALLAGLRECIQEYIDRLPQDRTHPMLVRRSHDFEFSASWSVRLWPRGYHTMHVHPLGWISSAYYVQVPPEIAATDSRGGGLKFGEPDIDLGDLGEARRRIRPAVGRLVLFPSYMWHGTEPFDAGGPRATVAFDVVPRKD